MQVGAQVKAELTHKGFGCTVDVAARVWPAAGGGTDIDHVTTIALDHSRQHGAGHVHQPFIVGVDHRFPVFDAGFMRRFKTQRQPGVIHQYVDGLPFSGQISQHLFNGGAVTHVQLRGQNAVAELVFQLLQTLLTAAGGNHFVPVGNEATRDAFTKTCGRPGN
ncbi:hypothetical protein D3C75_484000 [compost metagenome]